jgi:hypothetical protein
VVKRPSALRNRRLSNARDVVGPPERCGLATLSDARSSRPY